MSDKVYDIFDIWCNECGYQNTYQGLQITYCPKCGHVNLGFSKCTTRVDLSTEEDMTDNSPYSQFTSKFSNKHQMTLEETNRQAICKEVYNELYSKKEGK